MILVIQFVDENTGQIIIFKNRGNDVLWHNSKIHEIYDFELLKENVMRLDRNERKIADSFYNLISKLKIKRNENDSNQ